MSFKKFGDWLITERGRNFSFGLATTIGISIVGLKMAPNTFFLDQYRDVVGLYKDGFSVPLSNELKQRFEKAINLVGIKQNEQKLFKPFAVFGFDTFHAGTAYSKYGAIIGMPINFKYKNEDNIERHLIQVNNESVPWELEEGQELLQSYVLSENAQLYAIAREIKMAESPKFIYETGFVFTAVCAGYGINNYLNTKLNLYARPRPMRMILYALVTLFVVGNYFFAKDYTQVYYERYVDTFLKEKDPIFAEGGNEYYAKILQRNRAVRKLLGKAGEKYYSVLGNENFLIRQKHIPLVHRKAFFETTPDANVLY